jgi:hypothetical protein
MYGGLPVRLGLLWAGVPPLLLGAIGRLLHFGALLAAGGLARKVVVFLRGPTMSERGGVGSV